MIRNIVIDLTQDGLAMMFRDYQVLMLEHLWRTGDLTPPEANSRELHEAVNKILTPLGTARPAISRASVINAAKAFAESKIWGFREETCKGGYRRVYSAIMSEDDLWRTVRLMAIQKLDAR